VNCLEFRRSVGAEPGLATPEVLEHRGACTACARFQDEMRSLDLAVGRALAVEPARLARPAARAAAPRRAGSPWLALAASLLVGVALAAALWVSFPAPTLAAEVLGHLRHEPQAWAAGGVVPPEDVAGVLGASGVRLREGSEVAYARRCWHEGHWVPHLVVRTPLGPVTVLLLAHREVAAATPVSDAEFSGVVLPAPRGSVAIATQSGVDVEAVAQQVFSAVVWE
jgi:hypothetical protein